jgi:hypothetical protein
MLKKLLLLLITGLLLAACAGSGGPAAAIESYVQALVAKDADALSNLSCAAWESDSQNELTSFDAVAVRLDGLACEQAGNEGGYTLVHCSGTLYATYEGEDRPLDLSAKDYLAVEEGGEWRMCGYK